MSTASVLIYSLLSAEYRVHCVSLGLLLLRNISESCDMAEDVLLSLPSDRCCLEESSSYRMMNQYGLFSPSVGIESISEMMFLILAVFVDDPVIGLS